MFDFLNNSVMENRTRNKKTVRRLLDKYGTLDNFMQNSTMAEDLEYKLAQGDSIVDEVERERQAMMRAMNSLPKQQGSSLDDNDMMRNARANQYRNSLLQTTHDSYLFSNPLLPIGDRSTLKQYANNQLSSTQSDVSVGSKEMEKNTFNQDVFINKTMRPIIENNEGVIPYPYLDTAGLITIGIGANINSNPLSMDWYYKNPDTGEMRHLDKENPNDLMLINSELDKLKNEPKGMRAEYYKDKTNLRIADEFLNNEYYKRAKEAVDNIQNTINRYNKDPKKEKDIPDFHKLPNPLQIVLMDMMYNMGQTRFDYIQTYGKDRIPRGYPSFWDAIANRDVDAMIRESSRNGLAGRNEETKTFIISFLQSYE